MTSQERSPNYPGFSLSQAVHWAKDLYVAAKRNAIPVEVVAKATGSEATKGVSGPARQKVAAMRQFGLIELAGHGQYRLSPLGFDLAIHDPADAEYKAALQKAATSPQLFADVRSQFEELPNDHALRIMLMKPPHDFSEQGARRFIKAFRDTLAFAKLDGERYTADDGSDSGQVQGTVPESLQRVIRGEPARRQPGVTFSLPLEDAERLEVVFVGNPGPKPSRRDLEAAIDYLELIKKRTPSEELRRVVIPEGEPPPIRARRLGAGSDAGDA